ncbi:MAG: sodium:calcium antiporter [Candidatus Micrarchaeia archaeon]|jgi:cation:H+ antiporter
MLISIVLLFISILILAKASDWTIDGATTIAKYLKLSDLVIGFLLLSFATSLPELSVAITSGLSNAGGISVGNIFGANIVNITLAIGVMTLFTKEILINKKEIKQLSRIVLISIIIIPIILFNTHLGFIQGIILLLIFILFLYYTLKEEISLEFKGEIPTRKETINGLGYFIIGISLIIISASFAIEKSIYIISYFGITQSFLGATLISIGTTLPELTVGIRSIQKKHYNLALGNALGSCIINLTLILGLVSLLSTTFLEKPMILIIGFFAIISSVLLYYFLKTKNKLTKNEGLILVIIYLIYLITLFIMQLSIK